MSACSTGSPPKPRPRIQLVAAGAGGGRGRFGSRARGLTVVAGLQPHQKTRTSAPRPRRGPAVRALFAGFQRRLAAAAPSATAGNKCSMTLRVGRTKASSSTAGQRRPPAPTTLTGSWPSRPAGMPQTIWSSRLSAEADAERFGAAPACKPGRSPDLLLAAGLPALTRAGAPRSANRDQREPVLVRDQGQRRSPPGRPARPGGPGGPGSQQAQPCSRCWRGGRIPAEPSCRRNRPGGPAGGRGHR